MNNNLVSVSILLVDPNISTVYWVSVFPVQYLVILCRISKEYIREYSNSNVVLGNWDLHILKV